MPGEVITEWLRIMGVAGGILLAFLAVAMFLVQRLNGRSTPVRELTRVIQELVSYNGRLTVLLERIDERLQAIEARLNRE